MAADENQEITGDSIPVEVPEPVDPPSQEDLLAQERTKVKLLEEGLKRTMADLRNLERRTKSEIENGVNRSLDLFLADFLQIYDDFMRARKAASDETVAKGFDSIIKNVNALLAKYGVTEVKARGEVFDPHLHEVIATKQDDTIDEGVVTMEIRKGYISRNGVIRPSLVEVSKKSE